MKQNKKLKFYSMFKTDCHKADFLNTINNPSHKKTISKFSFRNHQLRIETGRHTLPKTPENLRICLFCHLNEVENELHFILHCHLYDNLRSKFFEDKTRKYPYLNDFYDNSKIIFFNNVNPTICRLTVASHAFVFRGLVLPPPHKRLLTQAPHSFLPLSQSQ